MGLENRTERRDDGGLFLQASEDQRMRKIWVHPDGCRVVLQIEAVNCPNDPAQYLTPVEAMAFARAFERCAIQALKDSV